MIPFLTRPGFTARIVGTKMSLSGEQPGFTGKRTATGPAINVIEDQDLLIVILTNTCCNLCYFSTRNQRKTQELNFY